ncbi:MAG: ATP-binding protein [Ruminococcus sp.]|nr:ATP-binding protein [Ruminococcus sp.]
MRQGKAILICGKICSGKSFYTEKLRKEKNGVVLSCDEIVFALFDGDLGGRHDEMTERIKQYFYRKSLEILNAGADVILEWGFWQRAWRTQVRAFYEKHGISSEFHYVDISDADWQRNISERNKRVAEGDGTAYYLDEGLMEKLQSLFEVPDRSEMDVWYLNERK